MATNALDVALEELFPSVRSVSPNGFNTGEASWSDGKLVLVGVGVGVGVLMSALVVCVLCVYVCAAFGNCVCNGKKNVLWVRCSLFFRGMQKIERVMYQNRLSMHFNRCLTNLMQLLLGLLRVWLHS